MPFITLADHRPSAAASRLPDEFSKGCNDVSRVPQESLT